MRYFLIFSNTCFTLTSSPFSICNKGKSKLSENRKQKQYKVTSQNLATLWIFLKKKNDLTHDGNNPLFLHTCCQRSTWRVSRYSRNSIRSDQYESKESHLFLAKTRITALSSFIFSLYLSLSGWAGFLYVAASCRPGSGWPLTHRDSCASASWVYHHGLVLFLSLNVIDLLPSLPSFLPDP